MHTIEELTPEQELQATQLERDWRSADQSTEPIDRAQTADAIAGFYEMLGSMQPEVIFAESPFQLLLLPLICSALQHDSDSNIDSLRQLLSIQFSERFEASAWKRMDETLWHAAENMLTQLTPVLCRDGGGGLSPLTVPGEMFTIFKNAKTGYGTVAGALNTRLTSLTNDMFSRAKSRIDDLVLSRLRSELLQTDRPTPVTRMTDRLRNRFVTSSGILGQLVSTLTVQTAGRTTLGSENESISRHTWYGRWGREWLLLYQFIRRHLAADFFDREQDEQFEIWVSLARGGIAYQFFEGVCFVCMQPSVLKVDDRARLHSDSGYALQFPDGYGFHSWHGVTVPQYVVEAPSKITVEDIEGEFNAEVKRIKIQIYGEQRYLQDSTHVILDESAYGTLLRKEIDMDEPLVMVRVKNSTAEPDGTFKYYYLRVPPLTATALEGVAWTFGISPDDYELEVET